MKNALPRNNINFLKKILGKKIVAVKRQLFKDDMDLPNHEQSADGPIEFRICDNSLIHFLAYPEAFSIGVFKGEMPIYGESYILKNVSRNSFWKERLQKEITEIAILNMKDSSEEYPCEFGVSLKFENGKTVLIQYLDDEDHLDMINVAKEHNKSDCDTYLLKLDK